MLGQFSRDGAKQVGNVGAAVRAHVCGNVFRQVRGLVKLQSEVGEQRCAVSECVGVRHARQRLTTHVTIGETGSVTGVGRMKRDEDGSGLVSAEL